MSEHTIISIIDHNIANKPKPAHHNKDLMTALLQMEVCNE